MDIPLESWNWFCFLFLHNYLLYLVLMTCGKKGLAQALLVVYIPRSINLWEVLGGENRRLSTHGENITSPSWGGTRIISPRLVGENFSLSLSLSCLFNQKCFVPNIKKRIQSNIHTEEVQNALLNFWTTLKRYSCKFLIEKHSPTPRPVLLTIQLSSSLVTYDASKFETGWLVGRGKTRVRIPGTPVGSFDTI